MENEAVAVQESICSRCIHKDVCSFKQEYLSILREANDIRREDYITIEVDCRFYKENVPIPRLFGGQSYGSYIKEVY